MRVYHDKLNRRGSIRQTMLALFTLEFNRDLVFMTIMMSCNHMPLLPKLVVSKYFSLSNDHLTLSKKFSLIFWSIGDLDSLECFTGCC